MTAQACRSVSPKQKCSGLSERLIQKAQTYTVEAILSLSLVFRDVDFTSTFSAGCLRRSLRSKLSVSRPNPQCFLTRIGAEKASLKKGRYHTRCCSILECIF